MLPLRIRRLVAPLCAAPLVAALLLGCAGGQPPAVATLPQGESWGEDRRAAFHFAPQGSLLIPAAWFMALERADAPGLFAAPDNLARFGFLRATGNAAARANPLGLPIGFAVEPEARPGDGPWLGLTCAACHTNEVQARGQRFRIEGAPAMLDFDRFGQALDAAVQATAGDPARLERMRDRLRGADDAGFTTRFTAFATTSAALWQVQRPALASGPGRVDALGQIINALAVVQLGEPRNARPPAAPTSFPFLWTTPDQDWVQWAPIAGNPIARNAGQVLGVFGHAVLAPPAAPGGNPRFSSSVRFADLHAIEQWLRRLEAPRWPEAAFGAIDPRLWERGQQVVQRDCVGCHNDPAAPRLTAPELSVLGRRFILTGAVPQREIGTDSAYTAALARRTVLTARAADLFDGRAEVPAVDFMATMVELVLRHGLAGLALSPAAQADYFGGRLVPPPPGAPPGTPPEPWHATEARVVSLKAGPLLGLWATGPFLHNGSVATLDELLGPVANRRTRFWTGSRELDLERLGFVSEEAPGLFPFDTTLPGNGNGGHDHPLPDDERRAVLEYLKDPLRFPVGAPHAAR